MREEEGNHRCDLFRFTGPANPFQILRDPGAEGIDEIIQNAGADGGWADGDKPVLADMIGHLHLMPVNQCLFRQPIGRGGIDIAGIAKGLHLVLPARENVIQHCHIVLPAKPGT